MFDVENSEVQNEGQTEAQAEAQVETQAEAQTEAQTETAEKRVRIPREEFMRVWEETVADLKAGTATGSGIKLVAKQLGLKENTVQQRATKYRTGHGIPLSKMPRGGGATFKVEEAKSELDKIRENIAKRQAEAAAETSNETSETQAS